MSLSNMQVFNKYIMPATIETLAQLVDKFNEASGGAIRLSTTGFEGDFLQESFFASIHSARRRVDRYAANASVAATDLTEIKQSSVKVAGGFGPIRYEPSQLTWLERPTAQGVEVASRNFAEAMMQDMLNSAIASAAAAIGNQAGLVNDVSALAAGAGALSYVAINGAHAKFGDQSGNLVAEVMSGSAYHKLIEKNLLNSEKLFDSRSVRVVEVLGRRVVVTDAPALYVAGAPNKFRVLSLVDSAVIVSDGSDVISNVETKNGNERIETTMQVDYTFGLGLKGYTWDTVNGGKSPSDAELATGSNWDKTATSDKHTAGVMTVADAAQ